jgi:hypothetical protein
MNFDLFEALAELKAHFGGEEVSIAFGKLGIEYRLRVTIYANETMYSAQESMPTSGFMQPTNHSPTRGDILRIMFHKLVQKLAEEISNESSKI